MMAPVAHNESSNMRLDFANDLELSHLSWLQVPSGRHVQMYTPPMEVAEEKLAMHWLDGLFCKGYGLDGGDCWND